MHENIHLIHDRWLQDNYRIGALGIIIRDYLAAHPTNLSQYEDFIDHWYMPVDANVVAGSGFSLSVDWYLPSLVENLLDWSYEEETFYRNMIKSHHPSKWLSLFPHALSRMPKFDLASALRWEPQANNWPEEIRKMFYRQLDATVSKTFVSIELNRPRLQDMNLLRLTMCLHPENYNAADSSKGKPWNAIWALLQHDDWKHQHDTYFKDLCDKWICFAPMQDVPHYTHQANVLMRNSAIQWHIPLLDNFVCRMRNADENGATLLDAWRTLQLQQSPKEKRIAWTYVLKKWTDWEPFSLLRLISDQEHWQQELQELILEHKDYSPAIKREILMYRCENNLIGPRDIEISKILPVNMQHIFMFWLVYNNQPLKKESVKIFQSLYKWHPLYEQEAILEQYLPGVSNIKKALHTMNIPWHQALVYAEEAMRSKADVHALVRKEFELNLDEDLFESAA